MFSRRSSVFLISTYICIFILGQICFAAEADFSATAIYQSGQPVYGLDWGDFDPCHAGNEVACLLKDGSVLQLSPNTPSWEVYVRHTGDMNIPSMRARPTIDIGDVYSGDAGNEIVVEGPGSDGDTHIVMVYYDLDSGWTSGLLFDSNGLIGNGWGARVGDFDSRYSGAEIFRIYELVMDFSEGHRLRVISPDSPVWDCQEEQVYSGEVGMDSGIGDFDPVHAGKEIAVLTEMGPAYEVSGWPTGKTGWVWTQTLMWDDYENAGWAVKIADLDNTEGTEEIVYGTRYNNRIMLSKYDVMGGQQPPEVVFTGKGTEPNACMWDIGVGDVLTESTALEIVGVDNTGSVYLVDYADSNWDGRTIFQDPCDPVCCVVAGDFVTGWKGDEILVGGQSGKMTMLTIEPSADFTNDALVNLEDFAKLASHWLEVEPSVDIAPWPYVDGIVDMKDLEGLVGDWLEMRL